MRVGASCLRVGSKTSTGQRPVWLLVDQGIQGQGSPDAWNIQGLHLRLEQSRERYCAAQTQ